MGRLIDRKNPLGDGDKSDGPIAAWEGVEFEKSFEVETN